MEKPSTKKPMNVLKTMVFLKNFMEIAKIIWTSILIGDVTLLCITLLIATIWISKNK